MGLRACVRHCPSPCAAAPLIATLPAHPQRTSPTGVCSKFWQKSTTRATMASPSCEPSTSRSLAYSAPLPTTLPFQSAPSAVASSLSLEAPLAWSAVGVTVSSVGRKAGETALADLPSPPHPLPRSNTPSVNARCTRVGVAVGKLSRSPSSSGCELLSSPSTSSETTLATGECPSVKDTMVVGWVRRFGDGGGSSSGAAGVPEGYRSGRSDRRAISQATQVSWRRL